MQTILIQQEIAMMISDLAKQLNISNNDVLKQAVCHYAEKIEKKRELMSFAGALDDAEAEDMLNVIRSNRINKKRHVAL